MLPPLLGTSTSFLESPLFQRCPDNRSVATDLCSLKPYVERLAFSVIWEMTTDAEIVNTFFTKSVIRSKAAFTYAEAQNRIDDLYASAVLEILYSSIDALSAHHTPFHDEGAKPIPSPRMSASSTLWRKFSSKSEWRCAYPPPPRGPRRPHCSSTDARRVFVCCLIQAGALTLASPEVRFTRSEETQDPIDMELYETKESNSLVEEFMLLANCSVAAKIYSAYPNFAMLRCVTLLRRLSVRWTLPSHTHLFSHQASPYASGEELYRPQKVGAFAGHGTVRAPLHEDPYHCCCFFLIVTISPPSPPSDTSSSKALADSLDVAVVRRTLVAITPAHCVDALLVGPDGLTGYLCAFLLPSQSNSEDPYLDKLVRILTTRCMSQVPALGLSLPSLPPSGHPLTTAWPFLSA